LDLEQGHSRLDALRVGPDARAAIKDDAIAPDDIERFAGHDVDAMALAAFDQRLHVMTHVDTGGSLVARQYPGPLELMARLRQQPLLARQFAQVLVEILTQGPRGRVEEMIAKQADDLIGDLTEPRIAGGFEINERRFQQMHVRVLLARSGC